MSTARDDQYPSRHEDQPRWQERLDPVVYRSDLENAPIAAEMIQRFERDGYLVIPNLFSAEEVAVSRRTRPRTAGPGRRQLRQDHQGTR